MGQTDPILGLSMEVLGHMDVLWTFFLLCARFTLMLQVLPGIGGGERGLLVRLPAIVMLSCASVVSSPHAAVPDNWGLLASQVLSEAMLGFMLGIIPLLIVNAVHMGAQLASTTMGLGAGNLIDPTLGMQVTDISRLLGDLSIILFLALGGHYAVVYAAAGLGGQIIPGTFFASDTTLDLFVNKTGVVFESALLISAPVIVALLLTNFVMGLISKAVPTVNIFIVSFPLTVGIGLILTVLSLKDISVFVTHQFTTIEDQIFEVVRDAALKK